MKSPNSDRVALSGDLADARRPGARSPSRTADDGRGLLSYCWRPEAQPPRRRPARRAPVVRGRPAQRTPVASEWPMISCVQGHLTASKHMHQQAEALAQVFLPRISTDLVRSHGLVIWRLFIFFFFCKLRTMKGRDQYEHNCFIIDIITKQLN